MFIETPKKIDRVFKKLGFDNYAIIGGIAVRYYTQMPRFTKDIDLIIDKEMSVGDWDKFKALFDAKSSQHGEVPDVLEFIVDGITVHLFPLINMTDREMIKDKKSFAVNSSGYKINVAGPEQVVLWKIDAMTSPDRKEEDKLRDLADILGIISTYTDIDLIKLHRGLVEEEYPENRFSNLTGDDKKRWEIVEAKIKEKLWK